MPIYNLNNKKYDIPDEIVADFEKGYPDATLTYKSEDTIYDIPVSKKNAFLRKYPNASLYNETEEIKPIQSEVDNISYGVGTQEDADSLFEINSARFKESDPKKKAALDMEYSNLNKRVKEREAEEFRKGLESNGEIQRLEHIKGKAQLDIDKSSFFDRFFDPETRAAVAARDKAEEALDTYYEANRNDDNWIEKNVGGVLRGIFDKVGDLRTWDFGASGVASAVALKDAVEKLDNGEELTPAEQNMLDAFGLSAAVESAYQDKVGTAYNVGGSLPESASFMASLALNPAGGVGRKIAEKAAKSAVKKYGTTLVGKLAKGAARVGGDIVEMGVATAVPGAGRVAEDYYNRLNGQSTFDVDDNGLIRYGGQIEQEEADTAIWKAFGSQFIENYSEAMGNYFAPMGNVLSNLTAKGLKAAHLGKFAEAISDISSSQWSKGIQRFKNAVKFDGLVGEYMEEVAGNVMNAATIGDMNFNSPDDPRSVFNPDTNIETFLSCALMSGTMYAVEAPITLYNKYIPKRNLRNADNAASELLGNRWEDLRTQIDEADLGHMAQILTGVENATDLSLEQKQAIKNYASKLVQYQAYNSRKVQDAQEATPEANEAENAYNEGTENTSHEYVFTANRAKVKAENALKQADESVYNALNEAMAKGQPVESFLNSLNDDVAPLARDYYNKELRVRGVLDAVKDKAEEEIERETKIIKSVSDSQTGIYAEVNRIDHDEQGNEVLVPGYITGWIGEGESRTPIFLEEGAENTQENRKPLKPSQYKAEAIEEKPMDEVISVMTSMIRDNAAKQAEQESKYAPEVLNASIQQGVPFEDATAVYDPFQQTPEGNAWQVKVYNKDENGKPSKDATGVNVITNDQFRDMLQAQYEANEAARQQPTQEVAPTTEAEVTNTPVATEEVAQTEEVQPEVVEEVQQPQQQAPMTLEQFIKTLPKKKGKIDYKAMTPQQQYQYTSLSESPEVALEDLKVDIAAKEEEIAEKREKLATAKGGERAMLRDEIKELNASYEDLKSFYESVAPNQESQSSYESIAPEEVVVEEVAEQPIAQVEEQPKQAEKPTIVAEVQENQPKAKSKRTPRKKKAELNEGESTSESPEIIAEEQRRIPLRERAKSWSDALGVEVTIIESVDDISNELVKQDVIQIHNKGRLAPGWVTGGKVYFLLSDIQNMEEIDNTYIHEVVAHIGIEKLLGEERFGEFCDKVWEMMPQSAKDYYYNYPGVDKYTDETIRKRKAADEYIAYLAEKQELTTEEKTVWDSIVMAFRELLDRVLNGIIEKSNITNDDIAQIIKASYANLKAKAQNTEAKKEVNPSKDTVVIRFLDGSLVEGVIEKSNNGKVTVRSVKTGRVYTVPESRLVDKSTLDGDVIAFREKAAERLEENVGEVDIEKGDVRFAVKDILKGEERKQAIKDLMEVTGRSESVVKKWLKAEESLASVILNEDNVGLLDLEADESVPSIWNNSDYPQGTVEFSNICKKRLPFTNIYQRLQKEFPNTLFDAETLNTIRNTMKEMGEDVACALCFVEDRRQLLGETGQGFIDAVEGKNVELNENQVKALDKLKESGDKYVPNLFDIITLDGMKELRKSHPAVAQAFVEYNNARGMQSGRLFQAYSAYNREILKYNKKKVESINNNGGLRIFSFSDFEAHHLIDLVQVLTDCAAKGIKVQGYTKVPEFAKAVKDTGAKINRSLIAKGEGYVDENYVPKEGEAVSPNVINGKRLLFDTVEGIDVNDPNFFDSTNSKSVGNILVAINDEQARLAMADPFVDYIIGFHTSQAKKILKGKGIDTWTNYKNEQLDKVIETDENGNQKMKNAPKHGLNIYTDVLNPAEAEGNPIKTAKQFTERFLAECDKRGYIPRFHRFLNRAKDGRFLYTPGYHKFLIDFKLFDKNGKILPQEVVMPIFDNEFNKQILDDYVKDMKEELPIDEVYEAVKDAIGLGSRFRIAEKEVDNIVIKDTEEQKLPTNREEAFEYIPANGVSFPNSDQKISIKVSRKSVKHTSLHNNKDTFAIFAAMGKVIGNAVKIGSIPVAQDEIGHTHSVNIFYVPINVNGRQYSARLVVKELENKGVVLDELSLYNVSMHKEKGSVVQPLNASEEVGGITTEPKSVYKIKELIHNSQELDKEIIGISEETSFRVKFTEEEQSIIDNAKADGTYMKAPNGNPTNLTEKQWAQVRTDAFKKWFGDWENDPANASKIVDENGEPLVVYHGSEEDFTVFDKTKGRANMDIQGMFFSPWDDDARGYGSNVRAFYLNIRKPANENIGYKALKKYQGQNGAGIKAREYLVSQGYDGLNNEGQEYVAFEPTQIKSTTENVGTFDAENPDIRFRTSIEIDSQYPNWLEGTTTESGKHSTQVEGTRKTYNKIGNWIEENVGKDVSILDASSGMGYGTSDLRERGFNIEDVEPYQSEERKKNNPATYSSYADINKQYDFIISNAVLNVIPDDWRRNVLHDMAARLKDGGRMFINTRKAGEEKSIKDKIELDSPQELLVKRNGKIASYQKFFTPSELKEWVENELGSGYQVEVANKNNSGTSGLAAVVVTKNDVSTLFRIAPQEEVQAEVDKFTSKYNGKEVVVLNSTVSDEELESLGLDGEDVRDAIEEGTEGFYDPITDKIYIFADKADADTLERMLFHENGHGIFRKNKKFVEEFDKNAEGKFNSQRKQIDEVYKEHERKEELFVRIFDHALATGDFKHLEKYLSEELWNELNDILKDFGYDRQEESDRRRIGGTVRQGNDGVLQEETSVRNGDMEPDTREESKEERRRSQEQAERLKQLFDKVADMGLRGVLGNTNYDLAMLDIFYALPENERTDVAMNAVKIGGDVAVAVDEYLKNAEEPTLWDKVVSSIKDALRKVGVDIDLTTNDVKYLLWRSRKPLDRNSILDVAENIDARFRVFGGNSGYVGYSMSKRAAQAREEGRYPKSDFKKEYRVTDKSFNILVEAGIIDDSEWHHTSKYGNKTTFYCWEEPEYAEYYANNKNEIDKLSREVEAMKPNMEDFPLTQEGMDTYTQKQSEYRDAKKQLTDKLWNDFNPDDTPDGDGTRFRSTKDSQGKNLTSSQQKYFANSKAIDKDGNLLVLYHGTTRAGFTEFKSGWFTTSKEDAISYSGDRKGRLFNEEDVYQPTVLKAEDFRLGYMTFDTEEDRKNFLEKHPGADTAISKRQFEIIESDYEFNEDKESEAILARKSEFKKIWADYQNYEFDHLVDTRIEEMLENPDAYTENDFYRAIYAYDSNAYLDDVDEIEDEVERKSILVDALNKFNEDTIENSGVGIGDIIVATRVPRNGEGVKHNDYNRRTYETYINVENPFEMDAQGRHSEFESGDVYKAVKIAMNDSKFDGVIIRNWRVGRYQQLGDVVIPKNSNQIKLTSNINPTEDSDIRFRAAKEQIDIADERSGLIKAFDDKLKSKMFNFQEAFQDRMLSLKVLMEMIEGATGKKAKSFEDAYKAENQLGSVNRPAQIKWLDELYKPLLEEVDKLSKKYGQKEIERYIYCKSGLERNEVLRKRDAEAAYDEAKTELDAKLASNEIGQAQYLTLLQQIEDEKQKTLATDTDYSGIRGLLMNTKADELYDQYKNGTINESTYHKEIADLKKNEEKIIKDWKKFAESQVSNIENQAKKAELDALWDKINAATNETLRIDFESGMIDRETYEAEKKMMKYYVPLRNWENTTAEDMYEYRHDMNPVVSSNQKKAKGRKSQADNPIATIALMAQNAIVRGNRNKMKMKLYSFIANRPTSLASVRNVWYVRNANNEWEPQYADTSKAKTEAEIKQIMEQFELDVQKLEAQGDAFKGKMKQGMNYRANRRQKDEHVVTVMINGKEYGIYINGNPRAAQAVNGLTNAEGIDDAGKWIDQLKRYYGAGLTSWNPDFIIPNLVRDSIHASTMTFLDKGALAAVKYIGNTPKVFSQVFKEVSGVGVNDPKLHQYFEEFVTNGGETGYTAIHTLEDYKKEYDKLMNEAKGVKASMKKGFKEGISKLSSILEAANRIAEDVNRFNAYVTSREEGNDIVESIDAAKNITVNFNRKGALASNTTVFGKVASLMSRWILFFNPGVQGIYQLVTKSKLNPKRAKAIGATILASGFFMPMINELLVAAAGGDDEDDYWNLSDFKRRNNWLLFTGDGYITIPLPPVLRELYGIGDIMYGIITGHINPSKAIYDTLKQIQSAVGFVNLLPEVSHEPDMITYVKGFAPDVAAPILDIVTNTNFMGLPIAKWTDYNEFDPEYMRVYKGVSPVWKELSMLLNEVGGEEGLRSDVWGNFINPAMMEHLITSYTGGIGKTINNLSGMIADVAIGNKENIDLFRKTPVFPRFYTPNDEKTVQPAINRKYYDFNYEYNRYSKALKKYEKAIESGEHPEWQKYIDEMEKERIIEFINYFKAESKVLKKLTDKLNMDSQNKELERDVYEKKAEIATNSFKILRGN